MAETEWFAEIFKNAVREVCGGVPALAQVWRLLASPVLTAGRQEEAGESVKVWAKRTWSINLRNRKYAAIKRKVLLFDLPIDVHRARLRCRVTLHEQAFLCCLQRNLINFIYDSNIIVFTSIW